MDILSRFEDDDRDDDDDSRGWKRPLHLLVCARAFERMAADGLVGCCACVSGNFESQMLYLQL